MSFLDNYTFIESYELMPKPTGARNNKNIEKNNYDVIIDIDSINCLNTKGWRITYNNEAQKEMIEKLKKIYVSVLGNSNRGKTHILQKLGGTYLPAGYQIQTKGLSLKFAEGDIILMDTAGTNVPLILDDLHKTRPTQEELEKIKLCQIITNYILQTFIISQANVLICIVGMLDLSEQKFLQKIKNLCRNKKKLIVIHNLVHCRSNKDIVKYKDEVLLKLISDELIEKDIPWIESENKYKNLYSKYFEEKVDTNIRHFIYGNDDDDNENKEEMFFYNNSAIRYIKKIIRTEINRNNRIIENLISHIKKICSYALKKELKSIVEKDGLIKCEEKEGIDPKNILADELDNLIFIEKNNEPLYRYYKFENYFIIEIDLCSKYKFLKVMCNYNKELKETVFKINGEKVLDIEENDNSYYINKRSNIKRFNIEIKVKLENYEIKHIHKKKGHKVEMNHGILYIIFEVS